MTDKTLDDFAAHVRHVITPPNYRVALLLALDDMYYLTPAQTLEVDRFKLQMPSDEARAAMVLMGRLLAKQLREFDRGEGPRPTVIDDVPRAIATINQICQEMVGVHGSMLAKGRAS